MVGGQRLRHQRRGGGSADVYAAAVGSLVNVRRACDRIHLRGATCRVGGGENQGCPSDSMCTCQSVWWIIV